MKFNFYALLMVSLATYGIINAIKYTGPEQTAHHNGKAYWNACKNKNDLNAYCQEQCADNTEQLKACKMAPHTTE